MSKVSFQGFASTVSRGSGAPATFLLCVAQHRRYKNILLALDVFRRLLHSQEIKPSTRFVLIEAYRDDGAQGQHRETRHYQIWRDGVAPMMAEPRASVKFTPVAPEDQGG